MRNITIGNSSDIVQKKVVFPVPNIYSILGIIHNKNKNRLVKIRQISGTIHTRTRTYTHTRACIQKEGEERTKYKMHFLSKRWILFRSLIETS